MRLLPRGRGPARLHRRAGPDPRSSSDPATAAPPTTSTGGSDEPTPRPPRPGRAVRRTLTTRPTAQDHRSWPPPRSAAVSTLVIMGLIGFFLLIGAWPALHRQGLHFLTRTDWLPETGTFGIASLLWGTILVGLIALAVALPVGFGAALFISEYAPRSLKRSLISLVDLMAAVPVDRLRDVGPVLPPGPPAHGRPVAVGPLRLGAAVLPGRHADSPSSYTSSAFIAGIAVGVVVPPTLTSVMREVFAQAPVGEREAAYRARRHSVGDDPRRRAAVRAGGIIGGSCSAWAARSARRSWSTRSSPRLRHQDPPARDRHDRSPPRSPGATPSRAAWPCPACSGPALVLFLITLVINTLAGVVVSRSRSGAVDGDLNDHPPRPRHPRRSHPNDRPRRQLVSRPPRGSASVVPTPSWSPTCSARRWVPWALTWLVFDRLLPVSGVIGFWLTGYAAFLGDVAPRSARPILDRIAVTRPRSSGPW